MSDLSECDSGFEGVVGDVAFLAYPIVYVAIDSSSATWSSTPGPSISLRHAG